MTRARLVGLALTAAGCGGGGGSPDAAPPDAGPDATIELECQVPIACPSPATGAMTICGVILDLETNRIPLAPFPTGACDPQHPTAAAPCALELRAYDAIAFASDPTGATPLSSSELRLDECGRFRVRDLAIANVADVALVLSDASGGGTYRTTVSVVPARAGEARASTPLSVLRATTDQSWTAAAGLTGGTFVDHGVFVGIFLHAQAPVRGVAITRDGATDPANDWYFGDADPNAIATVAPAQDATGIDGAGLQLGAPSTVAAYGATGSVPAGCSWPSSVAVQIPGVAFVQRETAVVAGGTAICP